MTKADYAKLVTMRMYGYENYISLNGEMHGVNYIFEPICTAMDIPLLNIAAAIAAYEREHKEDL